MSILTKLPQLSSNLSPATQKKIVVTNNYDMPILTEFLLQLNPSQSPELKSIMKTSNSLQSPHKFVKMMKVNSPTTTTTNISIPNTADDENTTIDEEKSKNQLLTDSIIESNLFTDAWNEKNTQALRANFLKKVFGGGDGGSVVVIPPLKHLLLDDVPDPPERQQPRQLPHYHRQRQIIEIPLHSCDETIIQYY